MSSFWGEPSARILGGFETCTHSPSNHATDRKESHHHLSCIEKEMPGALNPWNRQCAQWPGDHLARCSESVDLGYLND